MKPGFYDGMTNQDYHNGQGVSSSNIKKMKRSVTHYLADKANPSAPKPAQQFGSLVHTRALEGSGAFNSQYFMKPAWIKRNTTEGKNADADLLRKNEGKHAVAEDDFNRVNQIAAALEGHPTAHSYLQGAIERAAYWIDPATGILCKAKADCITPEGLIVDLKTTEDASPIAFGRDAASYDYVLSAAHYMDGFEQAALQSGAPPFKPKGFVFVVVEKSAPFGIATYCVRPDQLERGLAERDYCLRKLSNYNVKSDAWGYSTHMEDLELPAWV